MGQPSSRTIFIKRPGFTLIELLIVVAIIAILAAIAVPNFLEAQTRSKVSRTLADMRTIRTALESYAVDNNKYPETDYGIPPLQAQQADGEVYSTLRLTTPIAYLSSIPTSPWNELYGGNKMATQFRQYLYVNKFIASTNGTGTPGTVDPDYTLDRRIYLFGGKLMPPAPLQEGSWFLKSVGPDNKDDRTTLAANARLYDPTNGTVSDGDIVNFSDMQQPTTR